MVGIEKLHRTLRIGLPLILCGYFLPLATPAAEAQQTASTPQTTIPAPAPTPATFPGALIKLPAGPPPPMAQPFVAAPAAKKPVAGPILPSPELKPTPGGGLSKTLQK
jgi:hypothetical protein